MIIFALSRNEGRETEIIRNKATRNAIFLTVLFLFGGMLYRVATGDIMTMPGLPKVPAAERIYVDDEGVTHGLF